MTLQSARAGRLECRRLAASQGALRRVATLVARGISPPTAFRTVAVESGTLVDADYTAINRYEPDRMMTIVGRWSKPDAPEVFADLSERWPIGPDTAAAAVMRTGHAIRVASECATSEVVKWARSHGIRHIVACPVWVEGRLWGVTTAMFRGEEPPPDTERRLGDFVYLIACTIAQVKNRADLIDSRARMIAASDATRRRIERDLHDGVQQHLVSLGYDVRKTATMVPPEQENLRQRLANTSSSLSEVLADLQEISRGLHPGILAKSGLQPALRMLARRSPITVDLRVHVPERLPEQVEVTVFYVVSEALTNAVKHGDASKARVEVSRHDGELHLMIRDDGVGGAELGQGSGLVGLKDRVEALSGTLQLSSPTGVGTSLRVGIPL